ncbi:MAG: hypothetical protein R3E91_00660 [Chlamydiales bacterium]
MLLEPFALDDLNLRSRIVMAPITRCMATDLQVPTEEMAIYYRERASVGLIITESTYISFCANGYLRAPGIFNQSQVQGWKQITQSVHKKGGKIFLQLCHAGMMGHSSFRAGDLPLSPSGISPFRKKVARTDLAIEKPRSMKKKDFLLVIEKFVEAAQYAKNANFDGIEIHGASGYLLDSFLHHHTNRRTDCYGQDKTRFVLEVLDAVIPVIKTGIRLSPTPVSGMQNMLYHPSDLQVFQQLLKHLENKKIAYVHVAADEDNYPPLGSITQFIRKYYGGLLIGGGGYNPESGSQALLKGHFDLVSFGRLLVANPNLTELIKKQAQWRSFEYSMIKRPPKLNLTHK